MKKWIAVGSLAAGLLALGAWRLRQSKTRPVDEFRAIPDEFSSLPRKEELVGA